MGGPKAFYWKWSYQFVKTCLINSGSVSDADGSTGCEICGVCGCSVGTTGGVGSVLSDIRSGNGVVASTSSDEVGLSSGEVVSCILSVGDTACIVSDARSVVNAVTGSATDDEVDTVGNTVLFGFFSS